MDNILWLKYWSRLFKFRPDESRLYNNSKLRYLQNEPLQKENCREIFDNSPSPMWLFDTATLKFIDVNEAATRHYGYSKQDFLSMSIISIRPPQDTQKIQELVKRNAESGEFYRGESRHIKKSGELVHVVIESILLSYNNYLARIVLVNDMPDNLATGAKR